MTMTGTVEEGDEEDDFFGESFQLETQVSLIYLSGSYFKSNLQMRHAVDNIEEKHCNNNEFENDESTNGMADVGDNTLAAMLKETPTFQMCSKLEMSRNIIKKNKVNEIITNGYPQNLNESPKFASTPTSATVNQKSQIISARSFLEASKSKLEQDDIEASPVSERLRLSSWGLPECVVTSYTDRGIRTMFPWQVDCLTLGGGAVLAGSNLVYSAPTSAGKTLVAELLMMKRVFETQKKALLILPFVSLAREKMFHLQSVLRDAGIRVEGFMGSQSPAGGLKSTDIAVATIEKANSLVNRLLEEGQLDSLACVVVDELHMLGDQSRGYLLELLLTKILYVAGDSVQIIGMSATLPNLGDLSNWLKAELYTTDFRPVPLTELIKVDRTLLDVNFKPVGVVSPSINLPQDTDNITWMCLETIMESKSVLVFCPIKSWVEKLAESVAADFYQIGRPDPQDAEPGSVAARARLQTELSGARLAEVLEQLARCPAGLDKTLARVIRMGVAFHHAGLTTDERDIVEAGFKHGIIRVLVATSTLSSGVNLPARRVILRCPLTYNGQLMEKLQYKQMVGRAGRKGVDTEGESILICKQSEREKVSQLVAGQSEPVVSCLAGQSSKLASSMKRAILEVIVSGAATSVLDVERYAACTLLAAQLPAQVSISDCVQFLLESQFIKQQESQYVATRLGLACLASSLAPDEGLAVYAELSRARRQFVLENELHLIYLIVPIYAAVSWPKLDWMGFLSMWEELSEDMKRVGAIVGVEERWMIRAMRGTLRLTDTDQRRSLAVHQRFYTALALHDLVNEVPLSQVAEKYGATKGMLQSLQQAASTFSGRL